MLLCALLLVILWNKCLVRCITYSFPFSCVIFFLSYAVFPRLIPLENERDKIFSRNPTNKATLHANTRQMGIVKKLIKYCLIVYIFVFVRNYIVTLLFRTFIVPQIHYKRIPNT